MNIRIGLLILAIGAFATESAVAGQRSFVSASSGNDANDCSRLSPCRNFAAAISATTAGGEVVVLDSGGFGPFNVGSSITIVAPSSVHAAVTGMSGTTILIAANAPDNIVLRGLYLNGLGADRGVDYFAGRSLHIDHCVFSSFGFAGLSAEAIGGNVFVRDTTARLNGATFSGAAMLFASTAETIRATIDHVHVDNNSAGITADGNADVTISDSTLSGSANAAIYQPSPSGTAAVAHVDGCVISNNNYGIIVTGTVLVSRSMLTSNQVNLHRNSGTAGTYGDNHFTPSVFGDNAFTLTIPLK
jgi:nitrous oxidase accessory protein NosD